MSNSDPIAAGLEAWRALQAASAALSLQNTISVGMALIAIRHRVLEEIGQDLPSGPLYTSAMEEALSGAGFSGLDLKLARQFQFCADNAEEVTEVYESQRSDGRDPSTHPSALQAAVGLRRRQAGKAKKRSPKALPSATMKKAMRELPEDTKIEQMLQLAKVLRSMAEDHLPDAMQESDEVIILLGAIQAKIRGGIDGPLQDQQPEVGISIRGVIYKTHNDAACALGIPIETIRSARKRGTLNRVGLNGCLPVTVRGVSYPSLVEAARALGVSEAAVSEAKLKGTLDTLGKTRKLRVVAGREVMTDTVQCRLDPAGKQAAVTLPQPEWAQP